LARDLAKAPARGPGDVTLIGHNVL